MVSDPVSQKNVKRVSANRHDSGEEKAADGLMKAVENVTKAGVKTKDLGGNENTKEVTEAVCREIEKVLGA